MPKPKCFRCGSELIWDSDGTWGDDEDTVSYYTCPCCGTSYEAYEPDAEEKKQYDYWK